MGVQQQEASRVRRSLHACWLWQHDDAGRDEHDSNCFELDRPHLNSRAKAFRKSHEPHPRGRRKRRPQHVHAGRDAAERLRHLPHSVPVLGGSRIQLYAVHFRKSCSWVLNDLRRKLTYFLIIFSLCTTGQSLPMAANTILTLKIHY